MRGDSLQGDRMANDYVAPDFFRTASPDRYELLKEFAKKNRKKPTIAESFLWQQLKGEALGVKFRRQHVIYDYIADFVCLEKSLVIEVDGGYHFVGNQEEEDKIRAVLIEQMGFSILRFTNEEVLNETENVIATIKEKID